MYVQHESLGCNICDLSSVAPSVLLHERTKSQLLLSELLNPSLVEENIFMGVRRGKNWFLFELSTLYS